MKNINKVLISLISLSTLAACSTDTPENDEAVDTTESTEVTETVDMISNEEEKLSVVTTFYPVYEFTERVAGDRAEVELMISGGTDVHHYEPSARDIALINDADMFVFSSHEMETWVESMLASLDNEDIIIIEQAEAIDMMEPLADDHVDEEDDHGHDDGHEEDNHEDDVDDHGHDEEAEDAHGHGLDPHVWLDPVLVQDQVETMKEAFIAVDPEGTDDYTQRAEEFQSELQELHEMYEAAFSGLTQRRFVTQHEAFGYLARRYDLTQMAVGGISSEVEVSPSRIAEINRLVEDYNIPMIYYQEGANSSIAETVANETGTEIAELYSLEYLPGEIQDAGQGYIEAMTRNLEALQQSIE